MLTNDYCGVGRMAWKYAYGSVVSGKKPRAVASYSIFCVIHRERSTRDSNQRNWSEWHDLQYIRGGTALYSAGQGTNSVMVLLVCVSCVNHSPLRYPFSLVLVGKSMCVPSDHDQIWDCRINSENQTLVIRGRLGRRRSCLLSTFFSLIMMADVLYKCRIGSDKSILRSYGL